MISGEDQRRFDEITRQLHTTDPEFVARTGTGDPPRHSRILIGAGVLLWAAVPALAFVGGWVAAMVSGVVLAVAGVLVLKARRW